MADTAVQAAGHEAHDGSHDDHGAHHTSTGLSNNKLAMWLFLGSECLLFGGLISTYMLYRGRHSAEGGPDQYWDIPFTSASSFVLLMSSLFMVLAHEYLHSLGLVDENTVRQMTFDLCKWMLGDDHTATKMAKEDPSTIYPELRSMMQSHFSRDFQVVRNFDKTNQTYIQ